MQSRTWKDWMKCNREAMIEVTKYEISISFNGKSDNPGRTNKDTEISER